MIRGFKDKITEAVFNDAIPKGFPEAIARVARRKLGYLNAATSVSDLRSPPGNRLEALKGDRKGQYSIRINDQFRVCFVWTSNGPSEYLDGIEILAGFIGLRMSSSENRYPLFRDMR